MPTVGSTFFRAPAAEAPRRAGAPEKGAEPPEARDQGEPAGGTADGDGQVVLPPDRPPAGGRGHGLGGIGRAGRQEGPMEAQGAEAGHARSFLLSKDSVGPPPLQSRKR